MSEIIYKFILIGNSGVGKEDFFRIFTTGKFYEKNKSTIGIEKKTFDLNLDVSNQNGKIEKKKFNISLFDTAGQEKFRSITFNYYKDADACLFIYDITDKSTFVSVKSWIENIKQSSSFMIKILIGNKLDLVEENPENRYVTEDEAKQMCDEYDMIWGGEHSIRNLDLEGLQKLLEKFVLEVYNRVGDTAFKKQRFKKVLQAKKSIIKKVGKITSDEESINNIAEEKKSRIKKNSYPSDDSDI